MKGVPGGWISRMIKFHEISGVRRNGWKNDMPWHSGVLWDPVQYDFFRLKSDDLRPGSELSQEKLQVPSAGIPWNAAATR